MGLSELLIGQNMNAHPDCLGIYVGLEEMYIAQTTRKDGGIVLESLVRVPIPAVDRTMIKPLELNEGFFAMNNWTEALNKVMSKKKWKTNRVVVSLSPAFCLLRHFVVPTLIPRKMWKNSIPLQARRYIHFPFEKAEYAYNVYEFETAATKQKRLGVVFVMTTKLILERLRKGLKNCGLDLVSVEPSSLSLARTFNDSDKEAVGDGGRIYSFFGKDMANFVFLNENVPVLLREVEISGSIPAERRRFEITNCTEFIAKQLEKDPFEEAVIAGVDADQWISALEAESKKPVRKWNLSEVYGVEMRSAGEIASVGASIKFFDQKTPDIDFTKGNRLSGYEYNACLMAWKIAVLAVIVLAVLIGKAYWHMHTVSSELSDAQHSQKTKIEDFNGLTANQIQSNLSRIQSQNSNLQGLVDGEMPITPVLVDLVNSIPPEVWITKLSYARPFPGSNNAAGSITLEGYIKSATKDGRDDLALGNKFKDSFIRQPNTKKMCGSAATISYTSVAGTGGSKSSAAAETATGEGTRFTLKCAKGDR
ncbi:MAG: hypothetical protein J6V32_02880 [Elusimicrobiaceae bacterium]|nr:hypothetical protein [Elusimicrobiaceae bacterium]